MAVQDTERSPLDSIHPEAGHPRKGDPPRIRATSRRGPDKLRVDVRRECDGLLPESFGELLQPISRCLNSDSGDLRLVNEVQCHRVLRHVTPSPDTLEIAELLVPGRVHQHRQEHGVGGASERVPVPIGHRDRADVATDDCEREEHEEPFELVAVHNHSGCCKATRSRIHLTGTTAGFLEGSATLLKKACYPCRLTCATLLP